MEWTRERKRWTIFFWKLALIELCYWRAKEWISSKDPTERDAPFLQDAERNSAYFGKFKPRYFMGIGPEVTWKFVQYADNPKGKWDALARQVIRKYYLIQKRPILKGCRHFNGGELKRGGANMHFGAGDSSEKMIMDLIRSAKHFCILYGTCDYLGKIKQDDLESCQDSASMVLTPRVQTTSQIILLLRRETSQHEHQQLRPLLVYHRWTSSRGNLWRIPNRNNCSSCRKSQRGKRQRTRWTVWKCILHRNLENRARTSNKAIQQPLGKVLHTVWKSWQTNKFKRCNAYSEEWYTEITLGQSKKWVFSTQKDACLCIGRESTEQPWDICFR